MIRFILLTFFCFSLYGFDINKTLVDANITFYQTFLQNISKEKKNDEGALQIILLKKLIELKKNPSISLKIKFLVAKNVNEYENNFDNFLKLSKNKISLFKSIKDLEYKLYMLKSQIRSFDSITLNLQYAFYKNLYDIKRSRLKNVKSLIKKAPQYFVKSLKFVDINVKSIKDFLAKTDENIKNSYKEIEIYKLKKERYSLLNKEKIVKKLNIYIKNLENKKENLIKKKLFYKFLLFSSALQNENEKAFFIQKDMLKIAEKIKNIVSKDDIFYLTREMEKAMLGTAETLRGSAMMSIKSSLGYFWEKINEPLFYINKSSISALKLFWAIFIFVLGFVIGNLYKKNIKRIVFRDFRIATPTQTLFANLGYYLIIIIAFFISLNIMGINLSSIALVAGALSVGIGFGLQNIVSNFVSGIILMFERSIKIGDYIELDEDIRGHITDIRMRSTTINTNSNIDIIVPNQDFIQNRVINWTMNDKIRRFEIPFSVAYGSDVHKVIDVVLDAVNKSNFKDVYNTPFRHTRVVMRAMGESSLDFELFVWIKGEGVFYPKRTTSRFLILIYDALNKEGIEIPFPQRDIHIRSIDGEIPLKISKN